MRHISYDPEASAQPATAFTFHDVIAAIQRNKAIVLIAAAIGAAAAFLLAWQLPVRYSAEVALISDASLSGIIDPSRGEALPLLDPSATTTIVETINSTVVIERAIAGLAPDLRARLSDAADIQEELATEPDPAAAKALETPLLSRFLSKNLEVTNSGRSYVIYVRYNAPDPEISASVANAVAQAYLDYRSELKQDVYVQLLENLEEELAALKLDLLAAERTAQTMREQVRLLALRSEALTGRQQDEAIAENSELYARQREAGREAEATAAVYERLLLNQREIQSRLATPELNIQLFAPALVPLKPSGFNAKPVVLVLGIIGGFLAGASLALLRDRNWRRGAVL